MLSKIKNYFLHKHLEAKKPDKIRAVCALERANTIGVLCEITDEDSYKAIFRIFTQLQQNGKIVHLIGYIDEKFVPFYCLQQLSADYFCQKQLTWCGEPNMVQVTDFIHRDFDILLDFNYRYHAPVEAILATAAAKFIVGSCPDYSDLYDLFIRTESGNYGKFLSSAYNYTSKLTGK
jgi:hypothetical protein